MHDTPILAEHLAVSRRFFLQLGAAGVAAWQYQPLSAVATMRPAIAAWRDIAKLEY